MLTINKSPKALKLNIFVSIEFENETKVLNSKRTNIYVYSQQFVTKSVQESGLNQSKCCVISRKYLSQFNSIAKQT
jgi:hypothetical protein